MTSDTTPAETLLQRDRWITIAGIVVLTLLAWWYVLEGAGTGMSTLAMTTWQFPPPVPGMSMPAEWSATHWLIMVLMWWVMMIAMMTPSATPLVLLYARATRHAQTRGQLAAGAVPTGTFLLGYLVAWLSFSIVATSAQWGLEKAGLVHGMKMWSIDRHFTAALLIIVGSLPVDAAQIRLSRTLQVAGAFSVTALAAGLLGGVRDGDRARRLLSRLLLVPDGAAVRRRHHEPRLDRRPRHFRPRREGCPDGPLGGAGRGRGLDCSGSVAAGRRAAGEMTPSSGEIE